ncbi:AAA family ATPase [Streptomyces sp. NPDC054933]
MITFHRLTMLDFCQYRGRQSVDFPRDKGVYIIYGYNGRGKTRLLNAFRWALYGTAVGRMAEHSPAELANIEARHSTGYAAFSVSLEFTHDGERYVVNRSFSEQREEQVQLVLERNGNPLSQVDAIKTLGLIAPRSISQFSLFDGELIGQYEALLDSHGDAGKKLEEAIERILGVPTVRNAKSNATAIQRSAQDKLAEVALTKEKSRNHGMVLKQSQDLRRALVSDQEKCAAEIASMKDRVSEIEEQLRDFQRAERALAQLELAKSRQTKLTLDIHEAKLAVAELGDEVWRAVLAPSAREKVESLRQESEKAQAALYSNYAAHRDRLHLQQQNDCPVCGSELSEQERTTLLEHMGQSSDKTHRGALEGAYADTQKQIRVLEKFARADGRLIAEREKKLRQLRLDFDEADQDVKELDDQLRGINQAEVRRLIKERDELNILILAQEKALEGTAEKIAGQDLAIKRASEALRKLNLVDDPSLELKVRVTGRLGALFSDSIDVYRAMLKSRVESTASALFTKVAHEPDFTRLKINDRYGLEIVDRDGIVVKGRSAGYEHLVALSLISALQQSASVRGPIVMDSPFGRLDTNHTRNVVAALPEMASQVILLAFDGEFDHLAAVNALGTKLVAEYELERISVRHTQVKLRETF